MAQNRTAKRKARKAKRTSQIAADATAANGATRQQAVSAFGNTARNGGGRVWTQANGRAKASKNACRGKAAWA